MLQSGTLCIPEHNPKRNRYGMREHLASLHLCGLYYDQFRPLLQQFCTVYVPSLPMEEQDVYGLSVSFYILYCVNCIVSKVIIYLYI